LKKQSQFSEWQNDVTLMLKMVYGDFSDLRQQKNKANQSQSPAFGRKSEARNPKAETILMNAN